MGIEAFVSEGGAPLAALLILVVEALVLAKLLPRRDLGRRLPFALCGLAAGAALMLALWAGLTGRPWQAIATFMALSFVFHALEVVLLLRPAMGASHAKTAAGRSGQNGDVR